MAPLLVLDLQDLTEPSGRCEYRGRAKRHEDKQCDGWVFCQEARRHAKQGGGGMDEFHCLKRISRGLARLFPPTRLNGLRRCSYTTRSKGKMVCLPDTTSSLRLEELFGATATKRAKLEEKTNSCFRNTL